MAAPSVMKGLVANGGGMKKGQATLTSAQGLIALLDEDDDRLRAYALKQLDKVVPDLWFEVSSAIATIEALYEEDTFAERSLAALLASKVSGSFQTPNRSLRLRLLRFGEEVDRVDHRRVS